MLLLFLKCERIKLIFGSWLWDVVDCVGILLWEGKTCLKFVTYEDGHTELRETASFPKI
jgi:hypothetical protein